MREKPPGGSDARKTEPRGHAFVSWGGRGQGTEEHVEPVEPGAEEWGQGRLEAGREKHMGLFPGLREQAEAVGQVVGRQLWLRAQAPI